jgi:triosephosphate isomerase
MLIAGNWKMNTDANSCVELARGVVRESENAGVVRVTVCPPNVFLSNVGTVLDGTRVSLGAQNMHALGSGAYTGEVSGEMLRSLGCRYVILGHSERRQYFGETDSEISRKVKKAIKLKLVPIVCVGENLDQRRAGSERVVVAAQVKYALEGLTLLSSNALVIAYEPVWAIGTGETASPAQAQDMHALIRTLVRQQFGEKIASDLHILYGGSMKPANAKDLLSEEDVDGGLIGGASLQADVFGQIIRAAQEVEQDSRASNTV